MCTRLQQQFRATIVGGLMASLFYAHALFGATPEVEPNDTQAQAQAHPLVITSSGASISAMMGAGPGTSTADLDIYAFDGKAGDVPVIMVVSDGNWDPNVSRLDSRIDAYKLVNDGTYYIAVTPAPRYLGNNFQPQFPDLGDGGAYTLI